MSLDKEKITDFGPTLYAADCAKIDANGHTIIGHSALMDALRTAALTGEKEERVRAVQAQRYAYKRKEALVQWSFDFTRIERKDLFTWTVGQVRPFFKAI